ncbi:MAG TPA: hypothetical protein VFA33_05155 [Bryobacteraceae bacterium]|nr:hypothetical protein [Bryobacteraceae bacterium]
MPDLKQEMADVAAAIEKLEAQAAAPAAPPAPGKVRLRHPHTGDIKEVDAVPEKLIPIMGLGYQQVKE